MIRKFPIFRKAPQERWHWRPDARPPRKDWRFPLTVAALSTLTFCGIFFWDTLRPIASSVASYRYYPYCDFARAAGAAPIHRGMPGYRSQLDADGDGIACEPIPPGTVLSRQRGF
ncbi:excalibur calcium-binding domain-containing protein [Sphingomonas sp. C3-2]|nr:excalibur calcium-binding domain-containing protein [Sphingomonas sp. C3-2]